MKTNTHKTKNIEITLSQASIEAIKTALVNVFVEVQTKIDEGDISPKDKAKVAGKIAALSGEYDDLLAKRMNLMGKLAKNPESDSLKDRLEDITMEVNSIVRKIDGIKAHGLNYSTY